MSQAGGKQVEIIPLASKKMAQRGIPALWVEETLAAPEQVVPGHGGRRVAHKRIVMDEKERLLRVVYEETETACGDGVPHLRPDTLLEGQTLKIEYDPAHDLLNLEFLSGIAIEESIELDGIIVDYAKDRRIVAIEVLDASKRTAPDPLHFIDVAIVR